MKKYSKLMINCFFSFSKVTGVHSAKSVKSVNFDVLQKLIMAFFPNFLEQSTFLEMSFFSKDYC